jgi:hypothetical protein
MMFRGILASAALLAASSMAFAESGDPEQQDACRPDVRRFCHTLKRSDGDAAFVDCLERNLSRLSKTCRSVLESNSH